MENSNSVWHQLIIPDPKGLSGKSVLTFLTPIVRKIAAKLVVASDLVGACPSLAGFDNRPVSTEDFLIRVGDATQYDWAFFFFFLELPGSHVTFSDHRTALLEAEVTVRLADDYYFYVYSQNETLVSELRHQYPAAEYKSSTFEGLDIPY